MIDKNKKSFLKTKKAAILGLLAVAALSFGSTWAYYNSSDLSLANPLSTSHSGATMVEDFDPSSSFLPGETVAKVVKFTNTGDMDLLLRVEVPPEEGWYTDGKEDTSLDTEYVIKNWSEYWATLPDGAGSFDTDTDDVYLDSTYNADENEWTEVYTVTDTATGEEKYYRYYKKVLYKNGDTDDNGNAIDTTNPILESITLSSEISNDRHSTDYSDKTYMLTFNAEAIPVEGGDVQSGALSEWGMSATVSGENVSWTEQK